MDARLCGNDETGGIIRKSSFPRRRASTAAVFSLVDRQATDLGIFDSSIHHPGPYHSWLINPPLGGHENGHFK
jgi:hypothetical protein